uniref:Serine-threonine/tyrosine-protein kinase catalytic domain-containing protein n=1 Tax=Brassica oleracea var. oleracea TaxID=109376 RepID=A0A0D3BWZ7_BRAOL
MPHTDEKIHCSQEIIFAVEVGILGCVRHKNLLSARGYCAEGQERLIVQMKIAVTSAHAIAVGVLLLEQVTVYEKKYGEIVDQKLNEKYVDEELERVIFVRLMCAQSETDSRPTISEVVEMLMNNLKEKMATTH